MDWQVFGATLFTILAILFGLGTIFAATSPIMTLEGRSALWAIPTGILCAVSAGLAAGLS